jgi:cytoskeletal protein CcmA (bactofilin family)
MFREKGSEALNMNNPVTDERNTTILREDASFEGKLVFDGNVLVNGRFKGEIHSTGDLTVGNGGFVEGLVEIGTVHIFGEVHGNIRAKQKIVINAPAVVKGDIVAPSLVIEEGAVFEGNCSMGDVASNKKTGKRNDEKVIDLHGTGNL